MGAVAAEAFSFAVLVRVWPMSARNSVISFHP
jgi:hypothetical protein